MNNNYQQIIDTAHDKHFKVYRISNKGIFDCLVYVQGFCVVGCSLKNWRMTFYRWKLDRLLNFLEACKPCGEIELIQGVNCEDDWEKMDLQYFGLKSKKVKYDEYSKNEYSSEKQWQNADSKTSKKREQTNGIETRKNIPIQGSLF